MKDLLRVGRFGPPFSSPQESHCRDAVEGFIPRIRRSTALQTGRPTIRPSKQASGYHRQGRVENTFFRYKSIIGAGLRARSPAGQGSEVVLGCEILNRMTALGRPVSYRIGR